MRITGGTHRGRTLKTLRGQQVRPTSDRVREALFSIIAARLPDSAVLDLFAGTGSLGLEALSRGAARATFVDKSRQSLDVIRQNVEALGLGECTKVKRIDVQAGNPRLAELEGPFDLVFIDPPYRLTERVERGVGMGGLLESLWSSGTVDNEKGLIVLEHDRRSFIADYWDGFGVSDTRTWGDTSLTFFKA